ncbi:MAG: hypothetical protein SPI65_04825 [Peptoniphilus sp.]|nr:hypothetical protein [Peptoniphilus sp.]MDD7362869.1 hypothetical protein [Bacillota bacterium]MDY6044890.1 hypothetical protein [Peptoniphilus sp.]
MSLFLAPIHQLMYDKIHYTDGIASAIADRDPAIRDSLDAHFSSIESDSLAEVIDTSNIHGWLAERVVLAEERLAHAAGLLAETDEEALLSTLEEIGRSEHFNGDAEEAFRFYDGHFLNGMPCDRVHAPLGGEGGDFSWRITQDVHGGYYDDPALYDRMITAWWRGLLAETPLEYDADGDLRRVA